MLKHVGIYPTLPVSSHVQNCVAFFRASLFGNVIVTIIKEHRQRKENDKAITSIVSYR